MPSLPDGIVIFILALILFGPKRLPVLARELGKWVGEFRRASNEFKMQMEDELRITEQADRQKEIAAIEAAAPVTAPLPGVPTEEPEHPHLPSAGNAAVEANIVEPVPDPLPIATSGELKIMPPATGLPVAQAAPAGDAGPQAPQAHADISPLLSSIPPAEGAHAPAHEEGIPAHHA